MTQYRKFYADFYGITWDTKEMEVHHVDFNHENNDIRNLILLPKEIHRQIHKAYTELRYVMPLHPSADDLLYAVAVEGLLVGMSLVGDALERYIRSFDKCANWSLLKKVGYNTPAGEHIAHITPDTRLI